MAVEWFAVLRGKTLGPFTPDQLRGLAREGKVTRETSIRKGQDGDWVPAGRVQRLFETPETPSREDHSTIPLLDPTEGISSSGALPPLPQLPGESSTHEAIPAPPAIAGEQIYLNEQGVTVTNRWLRTADGTVHAVHQIALVRRGTGPRNFPWLPIVAIMIGVSLMYYSAIPRGPANGERRGPAANATLPTLPLWGIAAVGYGLYGLSNRKSGPWLLVSLSSGESRDLHHPDPVFLDRVRDALSWAIRNGP